jgi:hypothetical protein
MQTARIWPHMCFTSVLSLRWLKNNRVTLITTYFDTDNESNHLLHEEQVLLLVWDQIVLQFNYLLPDVVSLSITLHKPAWECKCRERSLNFKGLTKLHKLYCLFSIKWDTRKASAVVHKEKYDEKYHSRGFSCNLEVQEGDTMKRRPSCN